MVVSAHVAQIEATCHGVERESEGISETVRPDLILVPTGAVDKWVVGRDRPVSVDAKDLPPVVRERLRIGRDTVLPCRDVNLSIRSKRHARAAERDPAVRFA